MEDAIRKELVTTYHFNVRVPPDILSNIILLPKRSSPLREVSPL